MSDFRYAIRTLLKKPGFTIIAILAIALGIGANTAIFSVVYAVLLRPLPYLHPDRLVLIWQKMSGPASFGKMPCSTPDYIDYRDQTRTLENVAAFLDESFTLMTPSGAERVQAARVSSNLFPLLGVLPLRGRVFTEREDRPGNDQVVVISSGTWKRRFGSDPDVLGRTLIFDRVPRKVIGVMPASFDFPGEGLRHGPPVEFWVPAAFTPVQLSQDARGDNFNVSAIGRRKPGVTIEQASADIERIARRIHDTYPLVIQKMFTLGGFVGDLQQQVSGSVKKPLLILLGAVGFVLLIGCANVANLLLAQASGRRREVAIRTALGAGKGRLVRQLLTESMLLGLISGALGLLIAVWLNQLLIHFSPGDVPRLAESQLSLAVLAFALLLSILTGALFGLAPALQFSNTNLNSGLKEGSRGAVALRRSRLRSALLIAEVALSLILLAGAGLLLRSFVRLREVPLGFNPDHVLTLSFVLPETNYKTKAQVQAFHNELIDRAKSLPGVESAAIGTGLPMLGHWTIVITTEEQAAAGVKSLDSAMFLGVTPGFHQALGIQLQKGRFFTESDSASAQPVAIVNAALARHYWPGQNPMGKRFKWGPAEFSRSWITVAGVVSDVKQGDLAADVLPEVYLPIPQMPQDPPVRGFQLAARAATDLSAIAANLRRIVRELDPEAPLFQIRPMDEVLSESIASRRFNMFLLAAFAGLALLLAATGIYGVMSYSVSQYTHEIGIRMALGAKASDVLHLIVRQGMGLVLIGLGLGTAGALALTRFLSSLLFDIKPWDPLTLVSVSLLLAAVAFAASYIPARRATRVDPMIALRYE